jgi:hypothetical protein
MHLTIVMNGMALKTLLLYDTSFYDSIETFIEPTIQAACFWSQSCCFCSQGKEDNLTEEQKVSLLLFFFVVTQ